MIAAIWGAIMAFDIRPRLGLDLRGGTSVTFKPHTPNGGQPTQQQIETTIDIIRNRVNSKGVAESEVASEGGNLVVSIPDVRNSDDVIRAVGTTAQLQFGPVALGGTDITGAHAELQTTGGQSSVATGQWQTRLDFSGAGARKFDDLTGKAACNQSGDPRREIAITLDSVVINHPPVAQDSTISCNHGIAGGSAVIQGQTESEAKFLAPLISTGALPLTLENIDQNTVSATLGADSLRAGLIAGVLGLLATFIYVLLFYRGLGLVIWAGLLIAAALNVGIVLLMGRMIGFTLTLAGIAGLIVAIGISADSYVVFFERLKDEVRDG